MRKYGFINFKFNSYFNWVSICELEILGFCCFRNIGF